MAFLAPLFFAALAALAVPIAIHLTQRERKQIVEFPSLMFLEKIPYQSVRRRRIRDWPLLAMRMAAILLIVLAFSRPFFERPLEALAGTSGPREVVILLDRSYSMGYGDRWARAQAAARQTVQGLSPADHATLILFGTSAQLEVRATADLSRVTAAIDAAKLSAESTRYAPGLKLAQRVLVDSTLQTREVVMISDFQRNGWVRDESLRLPEGTTFEASRDHRRAAGQPHRVIGAASAFDVLRSGACHRRGGGHQPGSGRGQQRPGAPRARRTQRRNADRLGAAG